MTSRAERRGDGHVPSTVSGLCGGRITPDMASHVDQAWGGKLGANRYLSMFSSATISISNAVGYRGELYRVEVSLTKHSEETLKEGVEVAYPLSVQYSVPYYGDEMVHLEVIQALEAIGVKGGDIPRSTSDEDIAAMSSMGITPTHPLEIYIRDSMSAFTSDVIDRMGDSTPMYLFDRGAKSFDGEGTMLWVNNMDVAVTLEPDAAEVSYASDRVILAATNARHPHWVLPAVHVSGPMVEVLVADLRPALDMALLLAFSKMYWADTPTGG